MGVHVVSWVSFFVFGFQITRMPCVAPARYMYVLPSLLTRVGRAVTAWLSSSEAIVLSVTGSAAMTVVFGCGPKWGIQNDIALLPWIGQPFERVCVFIRIAPPASGETAKPSRLTSTGSPALSVCCCETTIAPVFGSSL